MPKRIPLYCEGDDDRAVLLALQKVGLLPANLEPKKPNQEGGGYEQALSDALAFARPDVNGRALVLRDLDTIHRDAVGSWLIEGVRKRVVDVAVTDVATDGLTLVQIGELGGGLIAVPVGTPTHVALSDLGIASFAIDDFVLQLAMNAQVYESLWEFRTVPHATTVKKLQ